MIRLILTLIIVPTFAAADWAPRPSMFTYGATLDQCTAQPDTPDLARFCEDALNAAYALKRAVARATFKCHPESLSTCAAPFENEGLPAIAARIAVDVGCDATDVRALSEDAPIPSNHCISVTSDIMIDEGVVPLFTEMSCGIECDEIAQINATFWVDQVDLVAPDDAVVTDLQMRNIADCGGGTANTGTWAEDRAALDCVADRAAALWADLVPQTEQD